MKNKKIVFFGTPDFSLPPLKTLYLGGYEVVGVYTQEPKKKSRGMKTKITPVHEWANSQLLPVFTPNLIDSNSLEEFKSLKPDIAILFAFGKIIPQSWLDVPLFGFINIHASLLPKWRGAAPIQRAIENNDSKTGITIMKMNNKLDEGPILKTKEIEITPLMNGEDLINIISIESCSLLYDVLKNYFKGMVILTDQDASKASYAHKISKEECQINWSETNHTINQKIKAFYPYPAMWFSFEGKRYKILKAKIAEKTGEMGVIIDNELIIACGQGSIQINEIQVEGKSKMNSKDFILGYKNFQIGKNVNA
ncbi:MAG: methionyl-tRNA formyltransferase [Proteobacteria bacterium]|nr:methionyl-tRNA formyltransferase [Pseudomonadota bacterium]